MSPSDILNVKVKVPGENKEINIKVKKFDEFKVIIQLISKELNIDETFLVMKCGSSNNILTGDSYIFN